MTPSSYGKRTVPALLRRFHAHRCQRGLDEDRDPSSNVSPMRARLHRRAVEFSSRMTSAGATTASVEGGASEIRRSLHRCERIFAASRLVRRHVRAALAAHAPAAADAPSARG
jgi:hypothetical protein